MAKRKSNAGRKRLIGDTQREAIYAILKVGGSITDAAGAMGISQRTIRDEMARTPDFRRGAKAATRQGKMLLIEKVGKSEDWKAAAWMLERKWGREFGKRDRLEHTGKDGGAIETKSDVKHSVDYNAIEEELRAISGSRMAGRAASNN